MDTRQISEKGTKKLMAVTRRGLAPLAAAALLLSTVIGGPADAADDKLKIGAPLALTGPLADEGAKQKLVWELWIDKVNKAGGIDVGGKKMPVELVFYDYQTNGQRAGQLAEKLINDDKVDLILAPFGSGHTKIVGAVGRRYQVPVVACVSSSESVFNQGGGFLFGTLSPNGGMTDAMVRFFKEQMPDVKKIAAGSEGSRSANSATADPVSTRSS